ncbi:amidohydrolase family protein [Microbacterium awajiense]|uniref:Amidohydrolase family protein n=1 Tax=Microbacterium awajiense TaxID=415214 RepID=A0ABP7AU24_9MICO
MIVDAHCHAWRRWPYDCTVPDPETRGSIESLLYEMDTHGVDHAAVVCARIGGGAGGNGFPNEDNNDYVAAAAARLPARLSAWVDVDCAWRPEYHSAGASDRLVDAVSRSGATGFTHYVSERNDGWLRSAEGDRLLAEAESRSLVGSLAMGAAWFDDLDTAAQRHPELPLLLHHMSNPRNGPAREQDIEAVVRLARRPNIGVKISGFNYHDAHRWGFPYPESIALFRRIFEAFGPERLYWGSDYPASRDQLTYTQSIEVVRTHCAFVGDEALNAILGGNASRLLGLTT